MIQRLRATYREYPSKFWVLVGTSFVDGVGRTLLFPFFTLYVTQRFNVGMTEAGGLLAVFSVSGFFGNMLGGGLTDRFGRRGMVLFGLVFSALSAVLMGLVSRLVVFYFLAVFVGFLSDIAGPAHGAMVADMLPERQRAEGFGVLRVAGNMAWIIGPTIGGLLASRSYLLLFVLDAVCSLITAGIVYRLIPETRPEARQTAQRESFAATFRGYRKVLADGGFLGFLTVATIMNLVYLQMYSTFSVYLRDVHGIPPQGYGFLTSLNAMIVVLFQFWVSRRINRRPPMVMMALGTAFYLVGFTMFGFVSAYVLFAVAMVVITVGEMIAIPTSQALVARFAPEDMRGRYMAIFSLAWQVPSAVGPWAAGMVMDNFNPNWVWYAAGILAAVAVAGFLGLHLKTRARFAERPGQPQAVPAS
ncbi:MAG: MFS transporter [Anaerolineales bacterium]|nr:MFS transporter [Anaerolineales bacterium]